MALPETMRTYQYTSPQPEQKLLSQLRCSEFFLRNTWYDQEVRMYMMLTRLQAEPEDAWNVVEFTTDGPILAKLTGDTLVKPIRVTIRIEELL